VNAVIVLTRESLEWFHPLILRLCKLIVLEGVLRKVPGRISRNVEKEITSYSTTDPNIIERWISVAAVALPVHCTSNVGVLDNALIYKLKDVLSAQRHIIYEVDGHI
jgi:hypothetical protein